MFEAVAAPLVDTFSPYQTKYFYFYAHLICKFWQRITLFDALFAPLVDIFVSLSKSIVIIDKKIHKICTLADSYLTTSSSSTTILISHRINIKYMLMQTYTWKYPQSEINNLLPSKSRSGLCSMQHWLVKLDLRS